MPAARRLHRSATEDGQLRRQRDLQPGVVAQDVRKDDTFAASSSAALISLPCRFQLTSLPPRLIQREENGCS